MKTELLIGTSVIAAVGAGAFAANYWLNWLAQKDAFFTRLPEGSSKAVMRGDTFDHFIMSFNGWHLNDPKASFYDRHYPEWEVLGNEEGMSYPVQDFFTHWAGVRFLGLNPAMEILKYQFAWNKGVDRENGKPGFVPRNEETDFIFVRDYPYVLILDSAETCEGVPVDLQYQLVVRITNPYKALFGGYNWLQLVSAAANRCVKNYVGSRTFKQLQSETDPDDAGKAVGDIDPDKFSCPIVKLTYELLDDSPGMGEFERGLRGRYGVTIISANPQQVALTGPHAAEYQTATSAAFLAESKAVATERQAKADAVATEAAGRAAANVIEWKGSAAAAALTARLAALKDAGELGKLMLQTDAMTAEGPGRTVVWANFPWIAKQPGLAESLDQFGITPDQLKAFIESFKKGTQDERPKGEASPQEAVGQEG